MKHNDRSLTFSIPASGVNTLDSAPSTLVTFPSDGLFRVPERLEIKKESGTAYSLDAGDYPGIRNVQGDYEDTYAEGFQSGDFLRIYEGTVGSATPRTWFKVKASGFLDTTGTPGRIVLPYLASKEFLFNVTSLLLSYQGQSISGGTGALFGTVFFKEYGITAPMGR